MKDFGSFLGGFFLAYFLKAFRAGIWKNTPMNLKDFEIDLERKTLIKKETEKDEGGGKND